MEEKKQRWGIQCWSTVAPNQFLWWNHFSGGRLVSHETEEDAKVNAAFLTKRTGIMYTELQDLYTYKAAPLPLGMERVATVYEVVIKTLKAALEGKCDRDTALKLAQDFIEEQRWGKDDTGPLYTPVKLFQNWDDEDYKYSPSEMLTQLIGGFAHMQSTDNEWMKSPHTWSEWMREFYEHSNW